MAAKSLGSLTIDLMMEIGGFQKGADAAERKLSDTAQKLKDKLDKLERDVGKDFGKKLGQNVGKNLASEIEKSTSKINGLEKSFGRALSGLASGASAAIKAITTVATTAAVAVTAAVTTAVVKGIEAGDQIDEMAQRYQISAEKLQELSFSGLTSGVGIDELGQAYAKLSKAMSEALDPTSKFADLFKALGIEVFDETTGKMRSVEDVLLEVADAFKEMQDPVLEAKVVMDLFGKSGTNLLEYLNLGGQGIFELMVKAKELGVVMGEETVAKMASFKDTMGTLNLQISVFGAAIAAELLPHITEMIQKFGEWIVEGNGVETITNSINAVVQVSSALMSEFIPQVFDLIQRFSEWVNEGNNVKNVVDNVNAAIEFGTSVIGFFQAAWSGVIAIVETAVNVFAVAYNSINDLITGVREFVGAVASFSLDGVQNAVSNFYQKGLANAKTFHASMQDTAQKGAEGIIAGVDKMTKKTKAAVKDLSKVKYDPNNITAPIDPKIYAQKKAQAQRDKENAKFQEGKIKGLYSGVDDKPKKTKSGGGGGGGSKSSAPKLNDEQKAAEKLNQTYDNLIAGMDKKIYMHGKEGQAAELSYDTQFGSLKDLTQAQKDNLLAKAQQLEVADAAQKQAEEANKAAEEAKKKEEEEIKRAQEITENLEFQLSLLGKTAEEQERLNLLRDLGSQANTQYGATALAALDNLQKASKAMEMQIEIADEVRGSFSGAFQDWISGTKSFKDAFLGALDSINARILQMIADNLMAKLFGPPGTPLGGSAGGGLGGIFGNMFGGGSSGGGGGGGFFSWLGGLFGRAAGGPVNAGGMYRVNETGPEMLSISGKDFLLMGNQGGTISSSNRRMGGGQVNNFVIQGRIDRRTQEQIAADVGRKSAQAQRRNY